MIVVVGTYNFLGMIHPFIISHLHNYMQIDLLIWLSHIDGISRGIEAFDKYIPLSLATLLSSVLQHCSGLKACSRFATFVSQSGEASSNNNKVRTKRTLYSHDGVRL